jgi:internalin A
MSECLNFQYSYSVWFDSLMARFVVRTQAMSERQPRWRYGVVLESGDNRALVRGDPRRKVVTISVAGAPETRRAFLTVIRSHFDALHNAIPNLRISAAVPLPRNPLVSISYDVLQRRLASGRITVNDPETGDDIDIRMLLGDVPGKREDARPLLFIRYAHKDRQYLERLRVFLKPFERDIDIWHDERIEPGQSWDQETRMSLERADVIVFLVSADFIAASLANDEYAKRALERHRTGEAQVVPVILHPCAWMETPLRDLEALPRNARPISMHRDRNAVWAEVTSGLKRIIDDRRDGRSQRPRGRS